MARLPDEEWLHLARKTAVGQQARHVHLREGRANLIVGNRDDRWWAYCQSCKEGGVVMKEHVLTLTREPEASRTMSIPVDLRKVYELPKYQQEYIAKFLSSKGMDLTMFNIEEVLWSESRQRLLVQTGGASFQGHFKPHYMGRDTSGKSPEKWLTYNGQHYLGWADKPTPLAVLCEDTFSYLKGKWATSVSSRLQGITWYCTLGTAIHDGLFLQLLKKHDAVASFYDGDEAGVKGMLTNNKRVRGAGLQAFDCCTAPEELDPKDMRVHEIQQHVQSLYSQLQRR